MKRTWVYQNGKAVDQVQDDAVVLHQVMPDIKPYQSMVDGSMITSRSKHRDHLRKHNCFEVGNETMKTSPSTSVDTRKEILKAQLSNMTHTDANKILHQLREEIRFNRR